MASAANEFVGRSLALSRNGLVSSAEALAVDLPSLWAVIAVETTACGFLSDRRPQILFERHLFHAMTGGQFDDGDISDPTPGGYGPPGPHQYDRLARAMQMDKNAALLSTSWGLGQILGKNYKMAGCQDLAGFIAAMSDSEDTQLTAVGAFIRAARLDGPLQGHDWPAFARGYNGPSYAENQYDIRLNGEYQKAAAGALPDFAVRTAQLYLRYRAFDVGTVDGIMGPHTRSAVESFQTEQGIPATGEIDDQLLQRLAPPAP